MAREKTYRKPTRNSANTNRRARDRGSASPADKRLETAWARQPKGTRATLTLPDGRRVELGTKGKAKAKDKGR